jgi:hypothetical protein
MFTRCDLMCTNRILAYENYCNQFCTHDEISDVISHPRISIAHDKSQLVVRVKRTLKAQFSLLNDCF